ncbi:cytochrome c biogenesis protein CcsA [bacterium]|nr:cytochrome c biogenesis protein CcsA [bacterium]
MTEGLYQNLFWYTFIFYLGGFLAFAMYFSLKKDSLQKIGTLLLALGLLMQTSGFVVKWGIIGQIRFQSMFEFLMLMSWAGVLLILYGVTKYKSPLLGIVITPIIVMLNAAAAMLDKSPAENLMPALQSNWLTIHISLAAIGAGAFVIAGAVSLFYLLSNHQYKTYDKKDFNGFLSLATLYLVYIPLALFFVLKIVGLAPHHTAFQVMSKFTSQMEYENARTLLGQLVIVLGLLFVPVLAVTGHIFKKKVTDSKNTGYGGVLFAIFALSFALSSLTVGILVHNDVLLITPQRHLGSIWRFFEFLGSAYIITLIIFPILYYLIYRKLGASINKIPGKIDLLDEINYRAVSLGYPLYTVGALFAGAIWAEQAWGTFWSWDPKEVGSLLVWFFYSAVLHARYNRDWKGNRLAILSIIGTSMIFVTFYGNYFFGGLHAYA